MVMFFIVATFVEPRVGWPHATLFGNQVSMLMMAAIIFTASDVDLFVCAADLFCATNDDLVH